VALLPGVLNRIIPGLLGMLQLKQRGANPDTLSDTVVPTIDVGHWYDADRPSCFAGDVSLTSGEIYATSLLLNVGQIRVPLDEVWWVRSYSVRLVGVDLPETVTDIWAQQLSPMILVDQLATSNDGVPMNPPIQPTIIGESAPYDRDGLPAAPTIGNEFASPSLRDVWAPPGSYFGVHFVGSITVTGGNPRIVGLLVCDRMKI